MRPAVKIRAPKLWINCHAALRSNRGAGGLGQQFRAASRASKMSVCTSASASEIRSAKRQLGPPGFGQIVDLRVGSRPDRGSTLLKRLLQFVDGVGVSQYVSCAI